MRRPSRRALGAATVAAILATGACDPAAVDQPGTVEVVVTAAAWETAGPVAGVYLVVEGPEVRALRAVEGYDGFTRTLSATESRIAVLGPFTEPGAIARFDVDDVGSIDRYSASLVQAAAPDLALLPTGDYTVRLSVAP